MDNIHDFTIPVHGYEELQSRRTDLLDRHTNLNETVASRRERLEQLQVLQEWNDNAAGLQAWIQEKTRQAQAAIDEDSNAGFTEDSIEIKLAKHSAVEAEVEKNLSRLDSLEQNSEQFDQMNRITENEQNVVADKIEKLREMWKILAELLSRRRLNLDRQHTLLKLYKLCNAFKFFTNDKQPQVESNDVGQNLEQCNLLQQQFENLVAEVNAYRPKLAEINTIGTDLLEDEIHNNENVHENVQEKLEDCNKSWENLVESVKNRKLQLSDAKSLHQFIRDANQVLQWMDSKQTDIEKEQENNLSSLSGKDYSKLVTGSTQLLINHEVVEKNLEALGDKVSSLTGRSAKLEESLNEKSDSLIEKRDELHKKWQKLQELSEAYRKDLSHKKKVFQFLNTSNSLINWANTFKDKFSQDITPENLTEVEAEISKHNDLKIVLDERKKEFNLCNSEGKSLDDFTHENKSKQEVLEELETSLENAENAWNYRDKHLQEVETYLQWTRDADTVDKKIGHVAEQVEDEKEEEEDDIAENENEETTVDLETLRRKRGFNASLRRQVEMLKAEIEDLISRFGVLEDDHYNYPEMEVKKVDLEGKLAGLRELIRNLSKGLQTHQDLYTLLRDYEIVTQNLNDKANTIKKQKVPDHDVAKALEQHENACAAIKVLEPQVKDLTENAIAPVDKKEDLENLWKEVNELADDHKNNLEKADISEKFDRQCDDLKSYLDEVEVQVNIPAEQLCRDLPTTRDATKRHSDLVEDFQAHRPQFEAMEKKAQECGADEIAESLNTRYTQLVPVMSNKTRKLDDYLSAYDLLAELNDVDDWVKLKSRQVNSNNVGRDLLSCLRLKTKHADICSELASNKQRTEALIERGRREKTVETVPLLADRLKDDFCLLNEQAKARTENLNSAEKTHEYFVGADEAGSWLTEKQPAVDSKEIAGDEDTADILLSRHRQLIDDIKAYEPRIEELGDKAKVCEMDELVLESGKDNKVFVEILSDFVESNPREISVRKGDKLVLVNTIDNEWSKVQQNDGRQGLIPNSCLQRIDEPQNEPGTPIIKAPELSTRSVSKTQAELEAKYNGLLTRAETREETLAKVSKALALQREAADLQRWIKEKENELEEQVKVAQENGDIDGAKKMLERTERELRSGNKRLNDLLANAKDAGVEGISNDDLLGDWNGLQKKYDDINDKLAGAYKLQRFLQDCVETQEWINEKQRILLTINPNMPGVDITQIEAMKRRHEGLQRDLQALGQRVHNLDETADTLVNHAQDGKLQPQLLGEKKVDMMEQAEIIQKKRNDLNTAWNDLVTSTKLRKKAVNQAEQYHKFLGDQVELIKWMDQMRGVMAAITDKKPTDIADAQNLIDQHRSSHSDLESRNNDFQKVQGKGEKLINGNSPFANQVEEKLNELHTLKRELMADWNEKNDRLNEEYKLQQFERDVKICETWIGNRENKLQELDNAEAETEVQKSANLQKSADLHRQIDHYQPRIDSVCEKADSLLEEDHFASEDVSNRKNELMERWDGLRNGLKGWQSRLGNAQSVQNYIQQADDIGEWIDDKTNAMPTAGENIDDDMIRGRQRRQDALQAELDANKPRIENLLNDGGELLDKQGDGDEECSGDVKNAMDKLKTKWDKLDDLSKANADKLREAAKQMDWLTDLKDFEMWIDEMKAIIDQSPTQFEQLDQAQAAFAKHRQRMTDVESQVRRKDRLESDADFLKTSGNFDNDLIESKMSDVNQKYDALNALGLRKERMLNEHVKALELLASIQGENAWISQKEQEVELKNEPKSKQEAEQDLRWLTQLEDDVQDRKERQLSVLEDEAKQIETSSDELSTAINNLSNNYVQLQNTIASKRSFLEEEVSRYTRIEQLQEFELWLKTQTSLLESEQSTRPENESLPRALSAKRKFSQLMNTYDSVYKAKINSFPELDELKEKFEKLSKSRKSQIDTAVSVLEFQWKMQAVQAWINERAKELANAEKPKDLPQCELLITKHASFEKNMQVFDEEAMDGLRRLAENLENSEMDQVETKWNDLQKAANNRKSDLTTSKKQFQIMNDLMAKFATEASRFNSWFEQVEEDFTDPIHADNVNDIKSQISDFNNSKSSLSNYENNVRELDSLDQQIKRFGNKSNPYTWHTMESIEKLWSNAQALITKRENSLKEELNRQEINDRLCQNYAEQANKFHDYLAGVRQAMNSDAVSGQSSGDNKKSNLEQHLEQLKSISDNIRSNRKDLDSIENQVADLDSRGVDDIDRYTKHSIVKLSQLYDQLTNQNLRMQHNLQQQIQAMNDSGVSEEILRDIQIMFKHFDKDNTGLLEHGELKSCLRALGVNLSVPEDPAEPIPEFEAVLDKLDPNRDGKISLNEYTSFMIQRETSKVSGTDNVIAAFKNIASTDKPYLTKTDVSKNLTKEQSRFAMENMQPFEDESGNIIPDTYDYRKFVECLFN